MISADHVRGIVAFVQVAEAGNFTLAGDRMGLSKSGIAKAISTLEQRLGFQLFHRTTRSFTLTVEGKLFYETCSRTLTEIEHARDALISHRRAPAGRLRINMPVVFGRRWILPPLLDIASRFPQLDLDISLTDRRIDAVEDGADLIIRVGDLDDTASMVARQLGVQSATVCATPSYLEAHKPLAVLDDLDHHACVTFSRGARGIPWSFIGDDGVQMSKAVKGRLSLNHSDAILDAVLAGYGPALLSTWLIAEHLRSGRLVALLPQIRPKGFPVYAIWPQTPFLSSKIRLVVDELVALFMPSPPWSTA